jgi:glycine amidinotransferase
MIGSVNEWDKLKDVIVGRVENAMFPSWDLILRNTIPDEALEDYDEIFKLRGQQIPKNIIDEANKNLDQFISILKSRGVKVRRPNLFDFSKSFSTPNWSVLSGVSSANPRDALLVLGTKIIECPMADRGRYFEVFPYRNILMDLSKNGYQWIAAPKPILDDDLYLKDKKFSISNKEPLFDAADFVRCGNLLIGQLSHVTNMKGVDWLHSILDDSMEIKLINSKCSGALHIDTTLIPLNEKTLLINPEFLDEKEIKTLFPDWKIIIAPKPESFYTNIGGYKIVSDWMSMNMLSLDHKTIIVEEKQVQLQKLLISHGFDVILCSFENYYIFGGSFHCSTLDIVRSCNHD